MKWMYSIKQKQKAALLLGLVLALIFVKNRIDNSNVSELGQSFSSVYEDRLMVESYIFQLSNYLHQKETLLDGCHSNGELDKTGRQLATWNESIKALIEQYEETRLTPTEEFLFRNFKENMEEMIALEERYVAASDSGEEMYAIRRSLNELFIVTREDLTQLSGIQVSEGKSLEEHSHKIVAESSLISQFELALLVVVALLIQGLIFTSKSVKSRFPQDHHHLN